MNGMVNISISDIESVELGFIMVARLKHYNIMDNEFNIMIANNC